MNKFSHLLDLFIIFLVLVLFLIFVPILLFEGCSDQLYRPHPQTDFKKQIMKEIHELDEDRDLFIEEDDESE